jgi:hypothetical protein
MRRIIRKALIFLMAIFLIIQFIRPARNLGSAVGTSDVSHFVHTPDTVLHILQASCYDCHSNHTDYPWYVNINPVGLWLRNHINDGKEAINFSDLSGFSKKKLDHRFGDISETVEKREMPLSSYTLIHRYAILDSGQIIILKTWVDSARKEIGYQE